MEFKYPYLHTVLEVKVNEQVSYAIDHYRRLICDLLVSPVLPCGSVFTDVNQGAICTCVGLD